jgi:hypothetical protein
VEGKWGRGEAAWAGWAGLDVTLGFRFSAMVPEDSEHWAHCGLGASLAAASWDCEFHVIREFNIY